MFLSHPPDPYPHLHPGIFTLRMVSRPCLQTSGFVLELHTWICHGGCVWTWSHAYSGVVVHLDLHSLWLQHQVLDTNLQHPGEIKQKETLRLRYKLFLRVVQYVQYFGSSTAVLRGFLRCVFLSFSVMISSNQWSGEKQEDSLITIFIIYFFHVCDT